MEIRNFERGEAKDEFNELKPEENTDISSTKIKPEINDTSIITTPTNSMHTHPHAKSEDGNRYVKKQ